MQTHQETAMRAYAQHIVEHLPVGIALFEANEFRLLTANERFESLLPEVWQQGRAIGHLCTELLPEIDQTNLQESYQRVRDSGVSCCLEASLLLTNSGEKKYWDCTLTPLSEQGQVNTVLLTLTEVTREVVARQMAEQAQEATLAQTHETVVLEWKRLAYIETILASLRNTASPTQLGQALLDAVDLCFSPQALALYSAHAEQKTLTLLTSQTRKDGERAGTDFPVSLLRSGDMLSEVMHQRLPLVRRVAQNTVASREQWKKEGTGLLLPNLPYIVCVPLWRTACEGVLVAAFAREEEIGELLIPTLAECAPHVAEALIETRLREAIAEEEHRLHSVLDQLPEGVVLVQARTGTIRYANQRAADLLGTSLPHLLGVPLNHSAVRSPYGLSGEQQRSAFRWNFVLIHALWGQTITNQELVIPRPDGSEIVVLASATPLRVKSGTITEAVMVFQDITAIKKLEQQKNEFFAVANHELRTPLTSILGFTELLQMHPFEDTKDLSQRALSSIAQECEHLSRLVHDLLDISRLEYGRVELKRTYQDLLVPLTQLITKQIQLLNRHHVHFKLEALEPDEPLMGWFDLLRIEQILRNLLSNAVKYSPVGTSIEIGVQPCRNMNGRAQEVLIWVKDQGMGIAPRDIPHIFERFYRASTVGSSVSGFGIGLYLTKQLVQGHEGRIWVKSTVGEGSTFFLALPLRETL